MNDKTFKESLMEMYNLGLKHGIEQGKDTARLEQLDEEIKELKKQINE